MNEDKNLLEELRLRAQALIEAKEKAEDKSEDDADDKSDNDADNKSDDAAANDHDDDNAEDKSDEKKSSDKKDDEIEDGAEQNEEFNIASVFEGESLSEEFKLKVTALFEAAVAQKVSKIEKSLVEAMEKLEEEKSQQMLKESEEQLEGLVERVDGYLDYMVEQWIENNEIALESGIKADLFESFMSGMQNLFSEHMINVPEDKIEVLEQQVQQIEKLESKVDEILAENVELKQALKTIAKQDQIIEAAAGLSEAEVERFVELAEELSFDNEETFGKKLSVIREQFFSTKKETKQLDESVSNVKNVVNDEPLIEEEKAPVLTESVDPSIAALAARLAPKK